jgi:hypothetical protein
MKKLPVGMTSFEEIRQEKYVYIDKTKPNKYGTSRKAGNISFFQGRAVSVSLYL